MYTLKKNNIFVLWRIVKVKIYIFICPVSFTCSLSFEFPEVQMAVLNKYSIPLNFIFLFDKILLIDKPYVSVYFYKVLSLYIQMKNDTFGDQRHQNQ